MNKKVISVGVLIITLLLSGIVYVSLPQQVRMRVDADKSTFYVFNENSRWEVSGREYNKLFDGTRLLYRKSGEITVETHIAPNSVKIERFTPFIRGPVIKDTYYFEGNTTDKERFPIYHTVEIFNGTGYFYRYIVDDLSDTGSKRKLDGETEFSFGKNMKVEIEPNYRWAWIGWPYGSDSLSAQYDIKSDYEIFNVRLFDPDKKSFNTEHELLENTDYCSIECSLKFKFKIDKTMQVGMKQDFESQFVKAKRARDMDAFGYRILKNVTKKTSIPCNKTIQYVDNVTMKLVSVNISGFCDENIIVEEYVDYNPLGKSIQADEWYSIEVWGKKKPMIGENNIDAKPCFFGYCLPYAWWNSSVHLRRNLTQVNDYLDPFLAGDKCMDINGTRTCTWVDKDARVLYYNNQSGDDIYGVNSAEDSSVDTEPNQGTFVDTGNPWSPNCSLVYHLKDMTDSCPLGKTLIGIDNPAPVTAQVGKGYDYDSNDYQYVSTNLIGVNDTQRLTFMAWVRPTVIDTTRRYIMTWYGNGPVLELGVSDDDRWEGWISTVDGNTILKSVDDATMGWTHLAITFNGTHKALYVNGTRVNLTVEGGLINNVDEAHFLAIACRKVDAGATTNFFDGMVDEAYVLNYTMNDTQIELYYNNTANLGFSTLGSPSPALLLNNTENDVYYESGSTAEIEAINESYMCISIDDHPDYENINCSTDHVSLMFETKAMQWKFNDSSTAKNVSTTGILNTSLDRFIELTGARFNATGFYVEINTSDDSEDATSCSGFFDDANGHGCSNATDENWTSYAGAFIGGTNTSYVLENYTVNTNMMAYWTFKYGGQGGTINVYYWNTTDWKLLASETAGTAVNKTVPIPADGISGTTLQINTSVFYTGTPILATSNYYEGEVIWENKTTNLTKDINIDIGNDGYVEHKILGYVAQTNASFDYPTNDLSTENITYNTSFYNVRSVELPRLDNLVVTNARVNLTGYKLSAHELINHTTGYDGAGFSSMFGVNHYLWSKANITEPSRATNLSVWFARVCEPSCAACQYRFDDGTWYIALKENSTVGGQVKSLCSKSYSVSEVPVGLGSSMDDNQFDLNCSVEVDATKDYYLVSWIEDLTYGSNTTIDNVCEDLTWRVETVIYSDVVSGAWDNFYLNENNAYHAHKIFFEDKYPENVTVNVGEDGTVEHTHSGSLDSTIEADLNATYIDQFMNDTDSCPSANVTCNVPIGIGSDLGGIINLSSWNISYSFNPIALNQTAISGWLSEYPGSVNKSLNLTINVTAERGLIQFDRMNIDFYGSAKYNVSVNFTSRWLYVRWSNKTVTRPYTHTTDILFFSATNSSVNVTPWGQRDSVPFYNITARGYDTAQNISVRVNSSLDSCLNVTASSDSAKANGSQINISYQQFLNNLSFLDNAGIWLWADLNNCSSRWKNFYVELQSVCTLCEPWW